MVLDRFAIPTGLVCWIRRVRSPGVGPSAFDGEVATLRDPAHVWMVWPGLDCGLLQ